jgi:hypothetical protein
MTDENVVQNGAANEPQNENNDAERAMVGKIARLPAEIREEINNRLFNGKSGREILAWLNELPAVKEILAAQFSGAPINDRNFANWRADGYQRWLAQKNNEESMEEDARYATRMADAAGGSFSRGVAAVASRKILKFLETPSEKTPENLVKLANASAKLCRNDHDAARLKIAHERLRQHERHLLLMRDKHQRDTTAILLEYLGDARAKEIEASDCDYAEKIELLGNYIYGDIWEPRYFPPPPPEPSGAAAD